jgi:pimeloyl-ACP methyl ester carboxylesterase
VKWNPRPPFTRDPDATPEETTVDKVSSHDGTIIAYDKVGEGPPLILVDGALTVHSSGGKSELARLLAPHLTVYGYDRRGRGGSGDTLPYAVDREIEDIDALIGHAGGSAFLYGHSSGGTLAMQAAVRLGGSVSKIALYEPPHNDDPDAQEPWSAYLSELQQLLADGRRGEAVALFMRLVGTPAEEVDAMRQAPFWPSMEAIAPTLAYDHAGIIGERWSAPTDLAERVRVPALLIAGDASLPFMPHAARALSQAMPQGQLRILKGETHNVNPAVLAPVLLKVLTSWPPAPSPAGQESAGRTADG